MGVLPTLAEAGQPGTLLGAVHELLIAGAEQPALAHTRALKWWARMRPQVQGRVACTDRIGCPNCRVLEPCPRDVLYQPVTRIATFGERKALDRDTIHDRLFGQRPDRRIHRWGERHPDVAAFMAWLVVTYEEGQGCAAPAGEHLAVAMGKGCTWWNPGWRFSRASTWPPPVTLTV